MAQLAVSALLVLDLLLVDYMLAFGPFDVFHALPWVEEAMKRHAVRGRKGGGDVGRGEGGVGARKRVGEKGAKWCRGKVSMRRGMLRAKHSCRWQSKRRRSRKAWDHGERSEGVRVRLRRLGTLSSQWYSPRKLPCSTQPRIGRGRNINIHARRYAHNRVLVAVTGWR